MDIKEFISSTICDLDDEKYEELKAKLQGEFLKFSFLNETHITREVFCEKTADYFEKVELKADDTFAKLLLKYVANLDDVVKPYIPKEPSAKSGEPAPQLPRSIKYYKYAMQIKGLKNLNMRLMADYSRIMLSLYMGAINAGLKEVSDYDFSTKSLELDKIINSLKEEKTSSGFPFGKRSLFDLEDLYSMDTATFVIVIIMFYYIKNNEVEAED